MTLKSTAALRHVLIFITVLGSPKPLFAQVTRPKLIVTLMIDQFRADYLSRFEKQFLAKVTKKGELGGFRYLMEESAYYPMGQYDLLNSVTCAGHATVLTGSYPYQNGIPINHWYSAEKKKTIYCVEDANSPLVGSKGFESTQENASPRNLKATTVGDELKNAGYPSRVVSVSLKDRSAILMGGHEADLALWYNGTTNEWVSSKHYLPSGTLPEWVLQLNREIKLNLGKPLEWKLTATSSGYSNPETEKRFPYSTQIGNPKSLASPYGDQITVIAAERAIKAYHLGQNTAPDLLAVSFSSHDKVGHAFGPNSREMEEMTLSEDRSISHLLNTLKKEVPGGLKNVVIVLSADHGVAASPDWAQAHKLAAGRIDEQVLSQKISDALTQKFGSPSHSDGNWIIAGETFHFYLNTEIIRSKKLDKSQVEAEAKRVILQNPNVAYAFTSSEYQARILPPGIFERQIMKSYIPGQSGDLVLIPRPFVVPGAEEGVVDKASHVSGYSYDRTVPILISGPRIKKGIYATRAEVVDIAPTLSFLAGVIAPSLSEGRVLSEALITSP